MTSHTISGDSTQDTLPLSDQSPVAETTFHVRYAETDQMGIVHHCAYIVWFEEGRSAWSRQLGRPYSEFEHAGYVLAVSEVGARYLVPARYDQRVTVRTWVSQVRSRLIRFEYEVSDAETSQSFVTGFSTHVCLGREGKPTRIPEEWRRFWSRLTPSGG